jgi:hypothetical protein
MARNSGTKLTKFISATTVVTADIANMWYGGLFGTAEGAAYASDDPVVAGHIHDGVHRDGHAQKINLVTHVTGQLRNANLADDAVIKRNVQPFTNIVSAIPEFEGGLWGDSGTSYYFDLTDLRATIANNGAFITVSNVTSNSPGAMDLDDFVVGSDSLDDDGDVTHDNRLFFDKSRGALRAGTANLIQWDNAAARGDQSVGFGRNNIVAAARATVAGGDAHNITSAGVQSFIGAGNSSVISAQNAAITAGQSNTNGSDLSFIGTGLTNIIATSVRSFIGSGQLNRIDLSPDGFVGAGLSNALGFTAAASRSSIVSGQSNNILSGTDSFIGSGYSNNMSGANNSGIVSGRDITITATGGNHLVGSGNDNDITGTGQNNAIVSGEFNIISSATSWSVIVAGGGAAAPAGNTITAGNRVMIGAGTANNINGANNSFIGAGDTNVIGTGIVTETASSAIVAGDNNTISATGDYHFIGSGNNVSITGATISNSAIVSGESINIDSNYSFVGSGINLFVNGGGSYSVLVNGNNSIIDTAADYQFIGTGDSVSIISVGDGNAIVSGVVNGISAGAYNIIGSGSSNTISSSGGTGVIGGGANNLISGTAVSGLIAGGKNNTVNESYAQASGYYSMAEQYGGFSHASGRFAADGDAQYERVIYRIQTTDDTSNVEAFLDGSSERFVLDDDSTYAFLMRLVARRTDTNGHNAHYTFEGIAHRNSGAASTLLDQITKTVIYEDDAAWDTQVTADSTNGSLKLGVTGEVGATINWVAVTDFVKVLG